MILLAGMSSFVISLMKSKSGLYSITWKCSTACTDFNDLQFLNQITFLEINIFQKTQKACQKGG